MKIVFLSNYFNHHQKPFSDEMYALIGDDYCFIETKQMEANRIALGWRMDSLPEYVFQTYSDLNKCKKKINDADVVITGSAPEYLLLRRKIKNKIIVRYSERPFKKIPSKVKFLIKFLREKINNPLWNHIYLLCASAYTAEDYKKLHLFKDKTYKWGYFPALKTYNNVDDLLGRKKRKSILWVARFIDWKHPEMIIKLALNLREMNKQFSITMIGCGELENEVKKCVEENDLNDSVSFVGSVSPEMVRDYMEQSEIFISTSDRNEGWGAVINEAMNSCCAVVANRQIGAAPFLIKNGENGVLYESYDDLCENVVKLLENDDFRRSLSRSAYNTICNLWNPQKAAENCLVLCESLLKKGECNAFDCGPCSRC